MSILIDKPSIGEFSLDTAGSSIVMTTDHAVAQFGFISLAVGWVIGPTLTGVSGGGLIWNIDQLGTPGSARLALVSAQAPAGLAAGATITATLSGSASGGRVMLGTSFTGVKPTSPVDVSGAGPLVSTTTAWTTGSQPLSAGSVLVGYVSVLRTDSTSTPVAPSIETHDVTGGPGSYNNTTEYRIESSAGNYAVAGTFSVTQDNGGPIYAAYLADPNPPSPNQILGMIQPIVRGRFA